MLQATTRCDSITAYEEIDRLAIGGHAFRLAVLVRRALAAQPAINPHIFAKT